MELSLLCDIKVLLCVYDKNDKMLIYTSDDNTTSNIFQNFTDNKVIKENFDDKDVIIIQ